MLVERCRLCYSFLFLILILILFLSLLSLSLFFRCWCFDLILLFHSAQCCISRKSPCTRAIVVTCTCLMADVVYFICSTDYSLYFSIRRNFFIVVKRTKWRSKCAARCMPCVCVCVHATTTVSSSFSLIFFSFLCYNSEKRRKVKDDKVLYSDDECRTVAV